MLHGAIIQQSRHSVISPAQHAELADSRVNVTHTHTHTHTHLLYLSETYTLYVQIGCCFSNSFGSVARIIADRRLIAVCIVRCLQLTSARSVFCRQFTAVDVSSAHSDSCRIDLMEF